MLMSEACLMYLVGMKEEWVAFGEGTGGAGEDEALRPLTEPDVEPAVERERARVVAGGVVEVEAAEDMTR